LASNEVHVKRNSDRHTLIYNVHEFVLSRCWTGLGEIRYITSSHYAIEQTRFSRK